MCVSRCCKNFFCSKCISNEVCPSCKTPVDPSMLITVSEGAGKLTKSERPKNFHLSAKLNFLVRELRRFQVRFARA